jgi:hypothetical protein
MSARTLAIAGVGIALGAFTLGALGNAKPQPGVGYATVRPMTEHEAMTLREARWQQGCIGAARQSAALAGPLGDLDVATAVLIANKEFYYGRTTTELRETIALLPRWNPADGISKTEAAALDTVLKLGRQLAYAEAAEAIERGLGAQPGGVVVADSSAGFTPEVLRKIKPAC